MTGRETDFALTSFHLVMGLTQNPLQTIMWLAASVTFALFALFTLTPAISVSKQKPGLSVVSTEGERLVRIRKPNSDA